MDELNVVEEPNDNHIYSWLEVMSDLSAFLVDAAKFYRDILNREENFEVGSTPLAKLLTMYIPGVNQEARNDEYSPEAFIEAIEPHLEKNGDRYLPIDWGRVSHGYVRFIKSMGYIYLQHLKNERNQFASRKNIPLSKLKEIDDRLVIIEERLNQGVFGKASLKKLMVSEMSVEAGEREVGKDRDTNRGDEDTGRVEEDTDKVEADVVEANDVATQTVEKGDVREPFKDHEIDFSKVQSPVPRFLGSIPILNRELHDRCMPLLEMFHRTGKEKQLDIVVSEAVRIFEDSLRKLSGAPDEANTAEAIIHHAFDGESPRLQLSPKLTEHKAGAMMYRGLTGFIRNAVLHRLQPFYTPERVIQIIGCIDFLLHRAETAERRNPEDSQDETAEPEKHTEDENETAEQDKPADREDELGEKRKSAANLDV